MRNLLFPAMALLAAAATTPAGLSSMQLFFITATLGAVGGLAGKLRDDPEAQIQELIAHCLYMACFGSSFTMILYWAILSRTDEPPELAVYLLIGWSGIAGLAGLKVNHLGQALVERVHDFFLGFTNERNTHNRPMPGDDEENHS